MIIFKRIKSHRDDGYKTLLGKNSDESGEETELFVRNKPAFCEIQYIEKTVEEGDTLQSLAIRYHCSVCQSSSYYLYLIFHGL